MIRILLFVGLLFLLTNWRESTRHQQIRVPIEPMQLQRPMSELVSVKGYVTRIENTRQGGRTIHLQGADGTPFKAYIKPDMKTKIPSKGSFIEVSGKAFGPFILSVARQRGIKTLELPHRPELSTWPFPSENRHSLRVDQVRKLAHHRLEINGQVIGILDKRDANRWKKQKSKPQFIWGIRHEGRDELMIEGWN